MRQIHLGDFSYNFFTSEQAYRSRYILCGLHGFRRSMLIALLSFYSITTFSKILNREYVRILINQPPSSSVISGKEMTFCSYIFPEMEWRSQDFRIDAGPFNLLNSFNCYVHLRTPPHLFPSNSVQPHPGTAATYIRHSQIYWFLC